jgi:peptide/nickel transport system substrate-binding protein
VKKLSVVLLAAVFVIAGCAQGAAPSGGEDVSEIVYGLTLAPTGIDPHINASAELGIPLRSVYDSLVYRDPETMDFVPGLASSWTISPDGLVYTFDLRSDVVFHDGEPFNAEAVRVTLERILNPDTASQRAASLLGPVSEVQVLGDYQVAIVLSEPFAPLLDGLSQPYIGTASPAALSEWDTATYQFHQVGTGPYRFVSYDVGEELVLERNPDYAWGPSVVANTGAPEVDRVVFRFFSDPATRALALRSGEVDIVGELLPTDAARLLAEDVIQLETVPIPGQPLQFFFNTQRPPTDSVTVRRALMYATGREAIVQTVFQGYSPVAYGPLSSATLYYNPSIEGLYAYDLIQADALFNSTGYVDSDDDGWRDSEGEPLEVNIVVPPWGMTPDVAQLLESQWEDVLDIQVTIEQVASFTDLIEAAQSGEYNLISLNYFALDPYVLNSFYESGAFTNWSRVGDTELDTLLMEAQEETDSTRRATLYADAQSRIMEMALVLPVREYVNLVGVQPGIGGLHFDAQGWFPYLTDLELVGGASE